MRPLATQLIRHLSDPRTDGELLAAFLASGCEPDFAELVRRHGPLVWGVCRRALSVQADAEDAFQAVFVVLLRKARGLTASATVGPWLYRVATWTTRSIRRRNARRAAKHTALPDLPATSHDADLPLDLDAALLALPEKYRSPVVLCHLLGYSRADAAQKLGCPEGTLSAWLSRGLAKLRTKLTGFDPAKVLTGAAVAVPAALSTSAVRAGVASHVAAATSVAVSSTVSQLAEGVLHMFWVKKATAASFALFTVFAMGLGVGISGRGGVMVATAQDKPGDGVAVALGEPLQNDARVLADLLAIAQQELDFANEGVKLTTVKIGLYKDKMGVISPKDAQWDQDTLAAFQKRANEAATLVKKLTDDLAAIKQGRVAPRLDPPQKDVRVLADQIAIAKQELDAASKLIKLTEERIEFYKNNGVIEPKFVKLDQDTLAEFKKKAELAADRFKKLSDELAAIKQQPVQAPDVKLALDLIPRLELQVAKSTADLEATRKAGKLLAEQLRKLQASQGPLDQLRSLEEQIQENRKVETYQAMFLERFTESLTQLKAQVGSRRLEWLADNDGVRKLEAQLLATLTERDIALQTVKQLTDKLESYKRNPNLVQNPKDVEKDLLLLAEQQKRADSNAEYLKKLHDELTARKAQRLPVRPDPEQTEKVRKLEAQIADAERFVKAASELMRLQEAEVKTLRNTENVKPSFLEAAQKRLDEAHERFTVATAELRKLKDELAALQGAKAPPVGEDPAKKVRELKDRIELARLAAIDADRQAELRLQELHVVQNGNWKPAIIEELKVLRADAVKKANAAGAHLNTLKDELATFTQADRPETILQSVPNILRDIDRQLVDLKSQHEVLLIERDQLLAQLKSADSKARDLDKRLTDVNDLAKRLHAKRDEIAKATPPAPALPAAKAGAYLELRLQGTLDRAEYTIKEFADGKEVAAIVVREPAALAKFLARTKADPTAPTELRVIADAQLANASNPLTALKACDAAGFRAVKFTGYVFTGGKRSTIQPDQKGDVRGYKRYEGAEHSPAQLIKEIEEGMNRW